MNILVYREKTEKEIKFCSNEKCGEELGENNFQKITYNKKLSEFCLSCSESLKRKFFCIFCKSIFKKDSKELNKEWIKCDKKHCMNWAHRDCEEEKGIKEIYNLLKEPKYNYLCFKCRKNKMENYLIEETPEILKIRSLIFEKLKNFDRLKLEKKLKNILNSHPNLFYFFNYNIIRINLKRMELNELKEIYEDLSR